METGGPSALILILAVLAANALLVLSAYGLTMWWGKKTRAALEQVEAEAEALTGRLEQIFAFLQDYTGITQPPYAERVEQLQQEASELQIEIERLRNNAAGFENQLRGPVTYRFQEIINAPFNGYRRWRRSTALHGEVAKLQARMDQAEAHANQISELPWELASQSRQAEKDATELEQLALDLRAQGVRGMALHETLHQTRAIRRLLEEIPAAYYKAGYQEVLEAARQDTRFRDSAIQVFHALAQIRPALEQHLPRAREWSQLQRQASGEFADLKQLGVTLRQSLAHPPEGLVVAPLQERLDHVAQMAAELTPRISEPDAEQLKPLAREVSRLRKLVQDTGQQFHRATRQMAELSHALADEHAQLDKMSTHFAELERHERLPLAWDESAPVLNHLRQRLGELGPASQPRTPGDLIHHLKVIESIRAEFKPLAEKQPRITEQHQALLQVLESQEVREGAAWLRQAREMLEQVAIYDPHNWPKQDSLQTLPAELQELAHQHEQLVPPGQVLAVQESTVGDVLREAQQLLAQHKGLRPRVESIRARLEKVQAQEEQGKQKLTMAFTALERVGLLTESNELLESIALDEIERLVEEIRQLGNELNAQNQGEIDKKIQRINTLSEKVNRALNTWLGRLNAAIAEQGKQIGGWIAQLDTVGILDDAPIQEARSLLARDEFTSALSSAPTAGGAVSPVQRGAAALKGGAAVLRGAAARLTAEHKGSLNELDATAEIKRKNDFWQSLLAAQAAMEENVGPLLTAQQETLQARQEAREALAEITRQYPADKRTWPPSDQPGLPENQVLPPVDEKWETLKKQHTRIDTAILDLGRLAQQYRLAAERAHQALDRIRHDQERVEDIEHQIEVIKERWQAQVQNDPNNPVIISGVQQLVGQADSRLAFIRHQYMRGIISYEEVVHNLRLLHDELFGARIAVDDHRDISLTDRQRRPEASNGRTTDVRPGYPGHGNGRQDGGRQDGGSQGSGSQGGRDNPGRYGGGRPNNGRFN